MTRKGLLIFLWFEFKNNFVNCIIIFHFYYFMNKSIKFFICFFLIALFFSSCASIFSKKTQNVVFKTSHPNTKIKFKNSKLIYADSINKDKNITLSRDAELVKFTIELDSHLTSSKIIAPTNLYSLYYLTYSPCLIPIFFLPPLTAFLTIPVGIFYIYFCLEDNEVETYSFIDTFNFINVNQKIKYWDSSYKMLKLSNVSVELQTDSNLVNYFDNIKEIADIPYKTDNNDESFTFKNTIFYKNIENQLIKTKFLDTLNIKSVFIDNTNFNKLECKITNINLNKYCYKYWTLYLNKKINYITIKIGINWVLKDHYGDILLNKYVVGCSGEYETNEVENPIDDAIVQSFTTFLNDLKVDSLMKKTGDKN